MSKSILLVEDNDQDEKLVLRILRKLETIHHVDIVRDGQQALDFLAGDGEYGHRKGAALPTVVLLDISLPRIDGLEVLRRMRGQDRTRILPVVMLTSSDDQQDLQTSYAEGVNSFVRKPLEFSEFAATLTQLITYWLTINHGPLSGSA